MAFKKKPRKNPCASCPYRRDVPSGVWHEDEYDKLLAYDGDIADQAEVIEESVKLFSCHKSPDDLCAGWVANTGDPLDKLAIRLGISNGMVDGQTACYGTEVPLFKTGAEAAEHGKRDIQHPGTKAGDAIEKIRKIRELQGLPVIDTREIGYIHD